MVALNVVSRLRHTNDLRAYRRKLLNEIQQSPLIRQIPALLDVPLPLVAADGAPRHLDDTLDQASFVLLAGSLGSGRTLAIQQIAQHLLSADTKPTPALIPLFKVDDGRSAPIVLLGEVLASLGGGRAARKSGGQPALIERLSGWALLITGLEELPAHRQTAWKATLQLAPQQWDETQVVVAVPRNEPRWTGYTTLTIASGEIVAERWVEMLAPIEHRATLANAVQPGAPLAPLATRLFEVALLACVARRGQFPGSRAALYDAAIAAIFDLDRNNDQQRASLEALQLLAAYDERPASLVAGMLEPTGVGGLRFTPALFGRYLAARQLVAENRFDLLAGLEPSEQREIARFCATATQEVAPLYAALWGNGRPSTAQLLTLGTCLRERPNSPPSWTVRIIGGLAVLARNTKPQQRAQAVAMLRHCRPALDATFATLVNADPGAQRVIAQLLAILPNELAVPYAENMAYSPATRSELAWELAELLIHRPAPESSAVPPAETIARARWTSVQALRSHESRLALVRTGDAAIIRELAFADLDDARLLRVAATLLEDSVLPTEFRAAGLGLLANNSQPTALTVIERACYDSDPAVRQAALARLASRDASRGQTALSRAALDHNAPNDTRIGAIERLATGFADESQPLLSRCARDTTLPLYAQLLAVAALNHTALGPLADTVRNNELHPDVRALAATQLGSLADTTYAPMLGSLLEHAETPSELIQGICAGVGALGEHPLETLISVLQRNQADVDVTVAIIDAIGRLKLEAAVPILGPLVGDGAWTRLERAIPAALRDLPAEEALASSDLPAPIAAGLADALARAATPANRPTVLNEFLREQADRVRAAAANALAQIGGASSRSAITAVLLKDAAGTATDAAVAALARTGGAGAEALGHLLANQNLNPMTHWIAVQHLQHHPQGEATMHRALGNTSIDSFTRGALAEALGQRGAITAMPLLRQLADEPAGDIHLRSQAIIGLGQLDEPATEVALVRILSNVNEDVKLRGLAAQHLPSLLSTEGRRVLRDLLRRERQPEALVAGALQTLGRVRDHEALPLALRYAQDENGDIARAALEALAELGDASVAPVLVRVAQNPAADRTTRLRAIGSLLKIGGDGYRPLVRTYLEDGSLPLRLQALEHLINAGATSADLVAIMAHSALPNALRLRALQACVARPDTCEALLALASNAEEALEIRVRAIEGLENHCNSVAIPMLIELVADAPDPIRLASIRALGGIGGTAACTILGNLAEGTSQPTVVRACARVALRQAVQRMTEPDHTPIVSPETGASGTYASAASP